MRKIKILLIAVACLTLLSACGGGGGGGAPTPVSGTKWTVMVYMAADNDLDYPAADISLKSLIKTGSNQNVTVILQYDSRSTPARRFRVDKGQLTQLAELGEQNMADPAVLADFIVASQQVAPADHYALILWDHGDGWQTGVDKQAPSLIQDWGNGSDKTLPMTNRQVADGIARAEGITGRKLDVLGVDACIMATLEAAYEFRSVAGFMVSSQDLVQGYGWDYADLLARMQANPLMTPRDVSLAMVESYRHFVESSAWGYGDQSMSAVQLGAPVESLAREIDAVAGSLAAKMADPAMRDATQNGIATAVTAAQKSWSIKYVDVQYLAENLDTMVSTAALRGALSSAVISAYHGSKRPQTSGLNIVFINLPEAVRASAYDFDYTNISPKTGRQTQTAFIRDYRWDEMMNSYFALKYPDLMPK